MERKRVSLRNIYIYILFYVSYGAPFSQLTGSSVAATGDLGLWIRLTGSVHYPAMGDMKTPDFDDLLAAFDIPDIDAKEAIQSTPDEPEGGHRPGAGGDPPSDPPGVSVIVKNTVRQEGFGEAGSDTEKLDERPLPTSATPASEQSLEMQNGFCVPSSPISSPSSSSSSPSSSPSSNSFSIPSIAANSSEAAKPLGLQHPQTVSNGDLWSPLSPKTSRETPGSSSISSIRGSITSLSGGNSADLSEHCKATNIFSRLRPLVAQSPVDLIGKGRERKGLLQQQQQQQQVHLQQHRKRRGDGGGEGGDDKMEIEESAASSASGVSDASPGVGAPFFAPPKPAPRPPSPATAPPPVSTSTLNLEPQNSNPSPRLLGSPPPPAPPDPSSTTTSSSSSSALFERNREPAQARPTGGRYSPGSTGFCSEESEPDIGSPLVIQESLESPTSSPPGSPGEKTREPSPVASSQPTTPQKYPEAPACPPPLTLPQPWPQPRCPAMTDDLGSSRKKSPEHIVEERDSPQSPEPEIQTPLNNKTPLSNSVVSAVSSGGSGSIAGDDDNNNNNNPAPSLPLLPSSPGAKQEEGEGEPKSSSSHSAKEPSSIQDSPESPSEEEEGEEGGGGGEEGEVMEAAAAEEEGRGSLKKVGSRKNTNGSNGKGSNKSASPSSTSSSSAPSRPLKVRIKTVKTSSGGITRTVTHVAPRSAAGVPHPPTATAAIPMETEAGGGGGGREGAVSRKPTPTAEAPKRKPVSLQLGDGARLKGPILPASTIQNASSAMLMAASKAQGRIAALAGATKPEKTKPLARAATGRPALSPANQKAVNGAASKPASIVNSGGAVISRSQTSLVEAFNRILNSKNLLPSYQPDLSPPAEWSLELPQCGYRCLECGDAFALERSLARHYDRRSMRIEVTCNHCARRLVFFNKCSLLLHAREHKDTGLVMQCSHLVMRPVSVEQMIGQQPDLTPATGLSKVRNAAAAAGGASNGGQGTPGEALTGPGGGKKKEAPQLKPQPQPQPQPQPALPLSCRKEELLQYRNFKCPECKKQFKGKTELAAHFQEVVSGSDSSCTQCAPVMMMSNPCSGSAHRRMHRHQAPHVCPECGGVARPAGFQTHLKEACLHFSRRIGYKCSSCQVVFGGLNSIKSHIQSVHCEVFHKCPTCPMAFKSAPGAHAHISTQHPGLESQQAKMIYKCVMCDTVFTHKALLHTHFDMHLAKQKVHVFKCPDCTKLYAQKTSMMEHIKSTHRNGGTKPEPPPPAPAQRPSPQKAVRSAGPVKPEPRPSSSSEDEDEEEEEEEEEEGGSSPDPPRSLRDGEEGRVPEWRCFECRARFSERDEYITHMRKDHGKSVKKFPCRLCDRSFCSAPSLRRHVRVNHEGIKRVFHCEYCTEGKRTFSSRLILEKHVRVRHGIRKWGPSSDSEGPARKRRAPLERDSSSDTEGGAAGGGGVRRRRMRVSTPTKIRKRKAPQPQPEPAGPFSCQKCGFTTESRPEFQAHIPQHRSDESSHQCSHCGLCFASQPSLNRHCFITHRVKQPSPPGDPSEGEEGPGQQGGLACQVCGKLCETAVDLRTHFRTHGMAFIRATKTGGAEK